MALIWDGKRALVVPFLDRGDIVYRPPALAPSLRQAIRFPTAPVRYGSLRVLFEDTARVFERRRFAKDDARGYSLIVLACWVPELFPSPPTLLVGGSDAVCVLC